MFEDSVEGFIARWRAHATDAVAFARAEGSPLIEVLVGEAVLQLFERTGPYEAPTGPIRLVLHGIASRWTTALGDGASPRLAAAGLSRLRVEGRVVEVDGRMAVVDAGVPVVLGFDGDLAQAAGESAALPAVGDWLVCESVAPAHGFVLHRVRPRDTVLSSDEQV